MNALGFELDQPEPELEDDEDEGWIDDDEWNEEQGCRSRPNHTGAKFSGDSPRS